MNDVLPQDAGLEELLRSLRQLATEVFGDAQRARLWLCTPVPALDNQAPTDLLDTRAGYDRARNALLRRAQGMYRAGSAVHLYFNQQSRLIT